MLSSEMELKQKKTVVLGASPNPMRYSYAATKRLLGKGIDVVPIGIRKGEINGLEILNDQPEVDDVHTITLYLNPSRQTAYYDYILGLDPSRIIFNPGTENPELINLARERGIETEVACTLVMLSLETY